MQCSGGAVAFAAASVITDYCAIVLDTDSFVARKTTSVPLRWLLFSEVPLFLYLLLNVACQLCF